MRSPGLSGPTLHLEVGDRVSHDKYGLGLVTVVDGVGSKATATIDFGSSGHRASHAHRRRADAEALSPPVAGSFARG